MKKQLFVMVGCFVSAFVLFGVKGANAFDDRVALWTDFEEVRTYPNSQRLFILRGFFASTQEPGNAIGTTQSYWYVKCPKGSEDRCVAEIEMMRKDMLAGRCSLVSKATAYSVRLSCKQRTDPDTYQLGAGTGVRPLSRSNQWCKALRDAATKKGYKTPQYTAQKPAFHVQRPVGIISHGMAPKKAEVVIRQTSTTQTRRDIRTGVSSSPLNYDEQPQVGFACSVNQTQSPNTPWFSIFALCMSMVLVTRRRG